jgi:3-methyladenine DNA glycosylase AlkD
LVRTRIFECNNLAYEIIWRHKKALHSVEAKDIEWLGQNLDNWASVDTLAVLITGVAWREGQIADNDVMRWLASENHWWRRLAVVSTVPLNLKSRGGTGDIQRTLMICERVVEDRNDMVVKALSWALRELSKRHKTVVKKFMLEHEDQLAARVRKEVHNKLETGRKNR